VPVLERITSSAGASYQTTVTGSAGAVPPSSYVAAINLHTGHYSIVQADANGAFATNVFAPGGSSLLLKCDPNGLLLPQALQPNKILGDNTGLLGLVGTVVQVPGETLTGLSPPGVLPVWIAEARTNKLAYQRDEPMLVDGTFTVLGGAAPGQTADVDIFLSLIAVSRSDGSGTLDQNAYCSTLMTPTGLPIEHHTLEYAGSLGAALAMPLASSGDRLRATFAFSIHGFSSDIEDGYYRPLLSFLPRGLATESAPRPGIMSRFDHINRRRNDLRPNGLLPVIRIGNPQPPRLHWTLLANTFSQGTRGVTAAGERDRFGVSTRIAMPSDRFVVPRIDAHTGAPIVYDLEPYAMTIAVSNKGEAINPPAIPFRFPSGSLTVTIVRPSGITTTIPPVPFRQSRLWGQGLYADNSGLVDANYFVDPYQLTTLDPRFKVIFVEDGVHTIQVEGSIVDLWGNTWNGGGTYLVDVATPLEIDSAVIPGTPLNVGDAINPSVQLVPAVPADVEVRIRFAPSSRRDAMTESLFRLTASPHGYAHLDPVTLAGAGEYRVDIYASWRDEKGHAWAGARTWGGVVAPQSSPVILHGKRGVDDQNGGELAWFSRKQIGLSKDTGGHVHFAFHRGDVQWMEDSDAATIPLSIFDPQKLITPALLQYCCAAGIDEELIAAGESPFYSIGANGVDPHASNPDHAELWAYAYRAVERPGVRIREMVSDEGPAGLYWRFDDRYALQQGTGANGDLPNDFKFQFGGAAFYGRALAQPVYATYASLFVLTANGDGDGTRVFPPFQGNGGGPSGGPLFTLKGREIDMFFHPTAVRAGTILTLGSTASFTGQLAPTLASKVEIVVTSPSGLTHTISGQANATGYFYVPAANFIVNEPGVWRARMRTWHDGLTSAGQVTQPFPTGDVLGSRDGEFFFYVADDELPLEPMPRFVRPADGPIAFTVVPPDGLTNIEVHVTTAMPGFILEEGPLDGLVYRYDATRLARDFPNLDLHDREGRTGVDTITISVHLSGTDASGERRHYARRVTLQGEEIQIPTQRSLGRRRSVRR